MLLLLFLCCNKSGLAVDEYRIATNSATIKVLDSNFLIEEYTYLKDINSSSIGVVWKLIKNKNNKAKIISVASKRKNLIPFRVNKKKFDYWRFEQKKYFRRRIFN